MPLLKVFILLAVVTLARAIRAKTSSALQIYLGAVIFAAIVNAWAATHYGLGRQYTLVYSSVRTFEITAMFWLARPIRFTPFPFSAAMAICALPYTALTFYPLHQWVEGWLFMWAAIALILNVRDLTSAVLGGTWLLVGAYDFGWAMGMHLATWAELNLWWPTTIYIAAFAIIAVNCRWRPVSRPAAQAHPVSHPLPQ